MLTRLPSRAAFAAFLGTEELKSCITANEAFFLLKKFRSLHPLNMQRDKFFDLCKQFKGKSKKGMFIATASDRNELERAIGTAIKTRGLAFDKEFMALPSAVIEEANAMLSENVIVSKSDFVSLLHKQEVYTNDSDLLLFIARLDPLFTNKVTRSVAGVVQRLIARSHRTCYKTCSLRISWSSS